ncbi:YgfZ/GcvT domain-containing protein [Luteimonas vadosa]|uniref:Folate-binding protein YgfZ n=1 Tax=Luteimonas vadosa TaxID=1165507 RepID=A0ABP9E3D3_9GAMM
MTDDTPFHALPDFGVVCIEGQDALAFAQAQFMSDVASLADAHWHWSGWLTPKGRVIALFAALRVDGQTLWLVLPDADASDFAARLQRFVFRSKLRVGVPGGLRLSGAFTAPAQARGAQAAITGTDCTELDLGGDGVARTLRISTCPAGTDPEASARWVQADMVHGLPRLPPAQSEQWTPQQLSLDRLAAYSVKKGCYPGQEIVARTHFLGQAKRGLVLLESTAPLESGSEVHEGGIAIGKLVCASAGLALSVLPLDRDFAGLSVAGQSVAARPLNTGLAR